MGFLKIKKKSPENLMFSRLFLVGAARFELATSWSRTSITIGQY